MKMITVKMKCVLILLLCAHVYSRKIAPAAYNGVSKILLSKFLKQCKLLTESGHTFVKTQLLPSQMYAILINSGNSLLTNIPAEYAPNGVNTEHLVSDLYRQANDTITHCGNLCHEIQLLEQDDLGEIITCTGPERLKYEFIRQWRNVPQSIIALYKYLQDFINILYNTKDASRNMFEYASTDNYWQINALAELRIAFEKSENNCLKRTDVLRKYIIKLLELRDDVCQKGKSAATLKFMFILQRMKSVLNSRKLQQSVARFKKLYTDYKNINQRSHKVATTFFLPYE